MNLCTYTENFSFTLMGSGDAILCADHPILGQAVIVLHLDYPNCYESQDAFSSGHVECTSLPHRSDVFLAVIGQQPRHPSILPAIYKKHRTEKEGSNESPLSAGH